MEPEPALSVISIQLLSRLQNAPLDIEGCGGANTSYAPCHVILCLRFHKMAEMIYYVADGSYKL